MHLRDSEKSDHKWGAVVDIEGWSPGGMHHLLLEEDIAWMEEGHIARCFGRQEQNCSMIRQLHQLHPFFAPWPTGKMLVIITALRSTCIS